VFALASDQRAGQRQTVVARQGARELARGEVEPGGRLFLRVPLEAAGGGCTLRLEIAPTWTPAPASPLARDTREVGLRFERVVSLPP
jgi:hypothetical protein